MFLFISYFCSNKLCLIASILYVVNNIVEHSSWSVGTLMYLGYLLIKNIDLFFSTDVTANDRILSYPPSQSKYEDDMMGVNNSTG